MNAPIRFKFHQTFNVRRMKKRKSAGLLLAGALLMSGGSFAQENKYTQRFLDLYEKIYDPANGYFSADGVPYHSVETLMCEAPDHGHETTSEAYSYWIWLDAMYGGITGDWQALENSWDKMERFAIPTEDLQPTTGGYNPNAPATFAGEHPLPDFYPSPLESGVPVGQDPVSPDLTATYGSNIYGMHWLFDLDNFYGYGNKGDGVSTPSYINTFQRGEQESVWETVPHPSWEDFTWGSDDGTGFLKLFVAEDAAPAKQWRYTNAPDADARVVQAMYWASLFAQEQGHNPSELLPLDKASKMGDFIRLAMFDKYFKPIGVENKMGQGGSGYESAHYLLSWYYAWGGPLEPQGWAWRIGCSHAHFGYQNPVAAYALSQVNELKPISANGVRDWGRSLDRQIEFYTWLQSADGAIAGGATNSWNGQYEAYPAGTSTFYGMAYTEHPVYHDPGSNQWFGMQAWSMERIAELYYITGDERTKRLIDKWVDWVKQEVQLHSNGDFDIPATLEWSGQPDTWNPESPSNNPDLRVTVKDYGKDLGIAGCLAKALVYYAAATEKYETLDEEAKNLAKEILDRMWENYYEENGKGVAVTETRGDFSRFFDQEVYIPEGWTGKMANGDVIEPGVRFIDIRSEYRNDPDFPALEAAYAAGTDFENKYHRFWAQVDIALANAEYGRFFGDEEPGEVVAVSGVELTPDTLELQVGGSAYLNVRVLPVNASNKAVSWNSSESSVASVSNGRVTASAPGTTLVTVTTLDGDFSAVSVVLVSESGNGDDDEDNGDFCANPQEITVPFVQNGEGEYCWVTSSGIGYINSWNLEALEINGVDFTNTWSNSLPEPIDGKYYIYYKGNYPWSHFEIPQAKVATMMNAGELEKMVAVYPNPFNDYINFNLAQPEAVKSIQVVNEEGQVVAQYAGSDLSPYIKIGADLSPGLYLVRIVGSEGEAVVKIRKQ